MVGGWPFVGRTSELAAVDRLLRAGRGAVLTGEPGAGKTALAREIVHRAASAGARTAVITAHAVSGLAPFEVFSGVLASVTGDRPPVHPAEVARRIPAALGMRPGERLMLAAADAHLLDDSSAQVLLLLAATSAACLVATVGLPGPPPGAVQRLWRDGLCERIDVQPLTGEDVRSLLESVLGGHVAARTVRAFARHSQGNPLLLRELVAAARHRSALVQRDGAWVMTGDLPLSSGIRELVTERLAGIGGDRKAALEVIAAGEPLSLPVAAGVTGEPMLEELEAARLVSVSDGLAGPEVATAHPLYGEVIRAGLPWLRLRRLRLALAQALESTAVPSPHELVRAALWRLDAGQADDPKRLISAARAARGLSLDVAERLARSALAASPSLDAALLLAEIMLHNGKPDGSASLLASLPPESLTQADREAIVYCSAVGQGLLAGDTAAGAQLVADVLAGVPDASDRLRALHALMLAFDARPQEAAALAEPLIAHSTGDPVTQTFAAMAQVGASYWLGRMREAVAVGERLLPVAAGVRDAVPFGLPSIELMSVCALAEAGDLGQAQQWAQRMYDTAVAADGGWAGAARGILPRAGRDDARPATDSEPADAPGGGRAEPVRPDVSAAPAVDGRQVRRGHRRHRRGQRRPGRRRAGSAAEGV